MAALDSIGESLEQLGLVSQRLDENPDGPIPTLLVAAAKDDDDVPTLFSLTYMSAEGTGLEHVDLVQMHFPLVTDVSAKHRGDVAVIVAELDGRLPVGHVGIQEDAVVLRCPLVLERGAVPGMGMLGDVIGILLSLHETFATVIGGVAEGRLTPDAARAALP